MSTPNPLVAAAAPSLIVILEAVQTLVKNLGTDPLQIASKVPGAVAIFLGTVEMQLPALAQSELSTVQADINTKITGFITGLKALTPAA